MITQIEFGRTQREPGDSEKSQAKNRGKTHQLLSISVDSRW